MGGASERSTGWLRNLAYDSTQYVVVGGLRADGTASVNELTELFLEQVVPRFENPTVVVRATDDMSDGAWETVCRKVRANAGILIYNDNAVTAALEGCGISGNDAVEYTMRGCNCVALPGTDQSKEYYLWLAAFVRDAVMQAPETPGDMDGMYSALRDRIRRELLEVCGRIREQQDAWASDDSGCLRVADCFMRGPIDRARSSAVGGDDLRGYQVCIGSLGSAADSLAAVDELVFRGGRVGVGELRQALEEDFVDREQLRRMCLKAPKFGRDDDRADMHAVRLVELVLDELDGVRESAAGEGLLLLPCTQSNMFFHPISRELGATAEGRRAGERLSDNTSPTPGACTQGLTAMFRSLAKLPFDRLCSGALNVRIDPRHVEGEEGLSRLSHLIRTYLRMGGLQVQTTLLDTATLRAAQADPGLHRDLMVRITGYSAAFVDLSGDGQEEIIRREEMGC